MTLKNSQLKYLVLAPLIIISIALIMATINHKEIEMGNIVDYKALETTMQREIVMDVFMDIKDNRNRIVKGNELKREIIEYELKKDFSNERLSWALDATWGSGIELNFEPLAALVFHDEPTIRQRAAICLVRSKYKHAGKRVIDVLIAAKDKFKGEAFIFNYSDSNRKFEWYVNKYGPENAEIIYEVFSGKNSGQPNSRTMLGHKGDTPP